MDDERINIWGEPFACSVEERISIMQKIIDNYYSECPTLDVLVDDLLAKANRAYRFYGMRGYEKETASLSDGLCYELGRLIEDYGFDKE